MKSKLQSHAGGMVEINLTSLIDVALVLVVIFMVMAPMVVQSSITISTPQAGQASSAQSEEQKIALHLKHDGSMRLNNKPVTATTMPESLRKLLAASATKRVVLSADERVLHEHVVVALDVARQAGAKDLTIVKRSALPNRKAE